MNNKFIKIPNDFVFVANKDSGELSKIKSMDKALADKIIAVLIYIHCNRNMLNNKCKFTIEELIKFLGYKPKTGKGKINDIITSLVKAIAESTYITNVEVDLNKVKINQMIVCDMDIFDEIGKAFFTLNIEAINKIMNSIDESKLELLNTYCYICSRVYTRTKEEQELYKAGLTDCKSETFYDTYEVMCEDLSISRTLLNKMLKTLQELELVFHDNVGSLFKDGVPKGNATNVYVLKQEELKLALNRSKFYYLEKGYEIKGKPSEKAKRINGKKGKAKQLENAKKDTLEESIIEPKEEVIEVAPETKVKDKPKSSNPFGIKVTQDIDEWGNENPFTQKVKKVKYNAPKRNNIVEEFKDVMHYNSFVDNVITDEENELYRIEYEAEMEYIKGMAEQLESHYGEFKTYTRNDLNEACSNSGLFG